jgi:hypothetical protein
MARRKTADVVQKAEGYRHPEAESLMRPDVGTQAQFTDRCAKNVKLL